MHCAHPKTMGTRPLLLVDLEATLDRHWFGSEVMLQGAIPALEPPIARPDRGAIAKWRVSLWAAPGRLMGLKAAGPLRPLPPRRPPRGPTHRPPALRTLHPPPPAAPR